MTDLFNVSCLFSWSSGNLGSLLLLSSTCNSRRSEITSHFRFGAVNSHTPCARNLHKNLMQVYHKFSHNNWPANHVLWPVMFMSCAGQFLSWNRAVLSCVQETCTRINLYQIDQFTHLQVSCTRQLALLVHKFLECVSLALLFNDQLSHLNTNTQIVYDHKFVFPF